MKTTRNLLTTIVAALTMVAMTQTGFAQIVPFKSVGTNNEYNPATAAFGGSGRTSHMGKSTGSGFAIPTPTDDPLVLEWSTVGGEFTAANGDQIFFNGGGLVFLNPLGGSMFTANWVGEFTVEGGTGRFSNVGPGDAPLSVIAINHPFDIAADPIWFYDYWIDGTIDLGHR